MRRDVGAVYVQMFDVALANWVGEPSGLCVHSKTCGLALAIEHNAYLTVMSEAATPLLVQMMVAALARWYDEHEEDEEAKTEE